MQPRHLLTIGRKHQRCRRSRHLAANRKQLAICPPRRQRNLGAAQLLAQGIVATINPHQERLHTFTTVFNEFAEGAHLSLTPAALGLKKAEQ